MQLAALVLAAALVSCTSTPPPADAPPLPCDLVSCAAGMALECCPPMAPRRTVVIPALGWAPAVNWTPDTGCMRSQGSGRLVIPVVAQEGDRLVAMGASIIGNGAADVSVAAFYAGLMLDDTSTMPSLGTITAGTIAADDAPGRWLDYTTPIDETPMSASVARWIVIAANQAGACVGAVRLTFEHPST